MTPPRLAWMTVLILAGLVLVWTLFRRRVFDPADKKAALLVLLLGFSGLFASGWFLLPAPEEGGEAPPPLPAGLPPLPPA